MSNAFTHRLVTLSNGLPVILVPMPHMASVTTLLLCNTGSRFEKPKSFGLAHFFEHMVFKGTERYPNAQVLAATVDGIGAEFNAYTGKEYTGYYVKSASEHLELALDVLSDMLLVPNLEQSEIDKEKGVIIEELNMYVDMPNRHIAELFEDMAFAGTGLGHSIIGTKETIEGMSRKDFQGLLHEWYGLENMILVIAGDATKLEGGAVVAMIERLFKKGDVAAREVGKKNLEPYAKQGLSQGSQLLVEYRQTEQAHFILSWPGMNRFDNDRYILSVLSTILGGNMSSRLFSEVREKRGLCYYVSSDTDMYYETGLFGASAGVDPRRVDEALKVTIEEFTQLTSGAKPITTQELIKAKDYLCGKMVLGLEDSDSVAQYYGMKQLLLDTIISPEQVMAKIKSVTIDELNGVAQQLIQPGQLKLAIIGPYKEKERFENIISAY